MYFKLCKLCFRSPMRDDRGRDRERSRRGDRPSRFSAGGGGGSGGGGGGGNFRDRSPMRGDRRRGGPSDRRVYVSNIAYEFRWQELKDLFRNEGRQKLVETYNFDTISVIILTSPQHLFVFNFSLISTNKC